MAIDMITGIINYSRETLDKREGPYSSVSEALTALDSLQRYIGLEVIIVENAVLDSSGDYIDGKAVRYVFENGITDSDLTPSTSTASGLEAIDEGSGVGWRLIGRIPSYYGAIGLYATDLSISQASSTTRGATGISAFAAGSNTEASGDGSVAAGSGSVASGAFSTALGNDSIASGYGSVAAGGLTIASGDGSVAFGITATASGTAAASFGFAASALGDMSFASGVGVIANNLNSTALGRFNKGVLATSIFEIGMGADASNRANAMEVATNGLVKAPEALKATLSSEPTDSKALTTVEYVNSRIAVSQGDKTYIHDQGIASSVWTINHNLQKRPSVMVMDSAGSMVMGDIEYIDGNSLKITFNNSFSGGATLN